MPAIACPKCNQKYSLPDSLIGKPVKCQKCGAAFKIGGAKQPAAAPAQQASAANSEEAMALKKMGLDGPIQAQSNGIFDSPPAAPVGGADPLGNYVVDPGFGAAKNADEEEERDALFDNPALAKKKKKKKDKFVYEPQKTALENYDDEPFRLGDAIKEVWFILLLVLMPTTVTCVLIPYSMGSHLDYIRNIGLIICGVCGLGVHIWGSIAASKHYKSSAVMVISLLVPFALFVYAAKSWPVLKPHIQAFAVCAIVPMISIPFMVMGGDNFAMIESPTDWLAILPFIR